MKKITSFFAILWAMFAFSQFPAPYCGTTFTSGVEPITLVNFAGINNTSPNVIAGAPIQDFTAISANVNFGSTYPIILKGNTDGPTFSNSFSVFADWNQNNVFTDAGETYNIGNILGSTGLDAIQLTGLIQVPATALIGTTRLRVVKLFGSVPTSCQTGTGFGETEDYSVTVSAPACLSPTTGLSTVNLITLTADLSWTAGGSASNFVVVQPAGTGMPATAAGTGVAVTGTAYTTTPLTINTPYEYYVRAECTGGIYSDWAGPYLFNTNSAPNCAVLVAPTDLASDVPVVLINSVATPSTRNTAVVLSWTAPTTAVAGYRIAFGTVLATLPVLNATGAPFAGTTVNITGILYNTTYYWRITPETASGLQGVNCVVYSFTTGPSPDFCLNGILSPAATFTPATCDGTTVNTITPTPIRAGRYSNVSLTTGQTYKFSSSVASDFITISKDGGLTAAAFGPSPLTWTSDLTGTTRVYVHLTSQCEPSVAASTRTTSVICGAALLANETFDANRFSAYPNPATNFFYLSNDKAISSVQVYNILGDEVISKKINELKHNLDISSLATGTYIVKVTSQDFVNTVKLIKE